MVTGLYSEYRVCRSATHNDITYFGSELLPYLCAVKELCLQGRLYKVQPLVCLEAQDT
jgi:hypothetical protein